MSDTENITCEIEETLVEEEVQIEEEPVAKEPVAEEPVAEEPVAEEPVAKEPVAEEPVAEEPVAEEPVAEEPVAKEPVAEEPVAEEPVAEEPVAKEPVAEEPVAKEPVAEEPVAEEPVAEEPVAEEPVAEEPVAEEPVAEEPVAKEPVAEEPVAKEPVAEEGIVEDPVEAVPKLIFIIPYRDRVEQKKFFDFQMKILLSDYPEGSYRFIYAHQSDQRSFNRGAMKNIGFLYAKSIYPNDYQSMTFVFNDVDTMPFNKGLLSYETISGNVKHFYGYHFTLGGIVSITGADFEKTGGFPNYWAWGYEDNAFQGRVKAAGLTIDRTQFYPILDKNILQLKDGITRIVNRGEFDRYVDETKYQNIRDGFFTISQIKMDFDGELLNITNFVTPISENPDLNKVHDMRDGPVPFLRQGAQRRARPLMRMGF